MPGGTPGTTIELAAYAYDTGVRPYSPTNANLLQEFNTAVVPSTTYVIGMDITPGATVYSIAEPTGAVLESKTVLHENACSRADEGYRLSMYFGGQCRAPSAVTVCYENENIV
jgi:hypothetical protein